MGMTSRRGKTQTLFTRAWCDAGPPTPLTGSVILVGSLDISFAGETGGDWDLAAHSGLIRHEDTAVPAEPDREQPTGPRDSQCHMSGCRPVTKGSHTQILELCDLGRVTQHLSVPRLVSWPAKWGGPMVGGRV